LANFAVHAEQILHAAFIGNFVVQFGIDAGNAFHLTFYVVHGNPPEKLAVKLSLM
jgi:hypothetical protein